MSEAKRIFEDGSPLERTVLAAADDDAPPGELEARIIAALPATAPLSSSAPDKSAPDKSAASALGTRRVWIALAALGLGAIIAGAAANRNDAPPAVHVLATPALPGANAPAKHDERALPSVTPDSLPSAPAAPSQPAKSDAKPSAMAKAAPTMETGSKIDDGSSLAREIAMLDAVKSKLGSNAAGEASRALDAYDGEFPQGALRPEATVLRIRTLLIQGNRASAEKLANDFLAKQPASVHANRIRALLAD